MRQVPIPQTKRPKVWGMLIALAVLLTLIKYIQSLDKLVR